MNWYQSDLDCFDTKHQFHSLGFHPQINYASSLQGQSEFSHQNGNFHLLGLSFAQEGKTKREGREGAMLKGVEKAHVGQNPARGNVTELSWAADGGVCLVSGSEPLAGASPQKHPTSERAGLAGGAIKP